MSLAEFVYTILLKPPLLRKWANSALMAILPRTVTVRGATIHLNPNDPVISGALTLRQYEREEITFFCEWFEPGMNFLDIGANVGLYSGLALSRSGFGGDVVCVEPDSASRSYLTQTIQSNKQTGEKSKVTVFACAASDRIETITLYKNSQNKGDNRIYPDALCDQEETIEAKTVDSLCEAAGLTEINFLKMDVQGAEAKAIRGAQGILTKSPDCILMTEFWPFGLSRCGDTAEGYLAQLSGVGFSLFELKGASLAPIQSPAELIRKCPDRVYCNLVGLKGQPLDRFLAKAT